MVKYRVQCYGDDEYSDEDENSELATLAEWHRPGLYGHVIEASAPVTNEYQPTVSRDNIMWPVMHQGMPPDYSDKPRRYRRVWIVSVAVFAILLSQFAPPGPPDTEQTWTKFFKSEGGNLFSAAGNITFACLFAFHNSVVKFGDVLIGLSAKVYKEWRKHPRRICPLALTQKDSLRDYLSTTIVNQSFATEVVTTALDSWDMNQPRVLIVAGTTGVGKKEMAFQVAHWVFQHCPQSGKQNDFGDTQLYQDGVLVLDSQDFSHLNQRQPTHEPDGWRATNELYLRIGNHVEKRRQRGAVVIIDHVEKLPFGLFRALCRRIQSSESMIEYTVGEGGASQQLETSLQEVIFVFTTDTGARSINQVIRYFGSLEKSPKQDLLLALQHEIDVKLGVGDGMFGQIFQFVAPFVPIERPTMESIFENKIAKLSKNHVGRKWKQLVTSGAAKRAFVDENNVDYIKWGNETVTVLEFSSTGGKPLDSRGNIMSRIVSRARRCLTIDKPGRNCVLDVDGSDEALFCWCLESNATTCSEVSCEEACRFRR